eukprot:scaffold3410_cov141-Cylindrotheca_fusiformis.AAC.4
MKPNTPRMIARSSRPLPPMVPRSNSGHPSNCNCLFVSLSLSACPECCHHGSRLSPAQRQQQLCDILDEALAVVADIPLIR